MRSASSMTRDSRRDNDIVLDCKRVSARDGVAITMSGLSESKILREKKKVLRLWIVYDFFLNEKLTVADVRLYQMQYSK